MSTEFTSVDKVFRMELIEIIKFQIITHCFKSKISLNETDLNCLALLGFYGEIRLAEFCRVAVENELMGSVTAVNNCLARVEKSGIFIKKGAGKKLIFLNPELDIQTKGNILLNYKMVRIETDKSQANNKADSETTRFAGAVS